MEVSPLKFERVITTPNTLVRRVPDSVQGTMKGNYSMKKLLTFAAVAAMSCGAFADLCDDDPAQPTSCSVYDVKISLKTLGAKTLKCTDDCASDCEDPTLVGYYENVTRTINGIFWSCTHLCTELEDGMNFVAWEKSKKAPASALIVYDGTNYIGDSVAIENLDRYSKKANKVQGTVEFPLVLNGGDAAVAAAGFGTYDAKNDVVKSISGYCVGVLDPLAAVTTECAEVDVYVMGICEDFTSWCEDGEDAEALVAYGTWSVKYNASLSKGTKRLSQIVPAYCFAPVIPVP